MTFSIKRILALFAGTCLSLNILAALPDEIQVYDGEINAPGESGLELHINQSISGNRTPGFSGERVTHHGIRLTPEFSYGLTEAVELGLYIPTVYTPSYGYEAAGFKARIKWLPIQKSESQALSLGLNVEYGALRPGFEESRRHFEFRQITAWDNDVWQLAINPIVGVDTSPNLSHIPDLKMFGRVLYKKGGELSALGLEYYQDLGPYNNFYTSKTQSKQVFAVTEWAFKSGLLNHWNMHVGLGYGWDSADRWILKMILTPNF
jgi:hypothetical protein